METIKTIILKWIITALLIYMLKFFFGKRVMMKGLAAALTVALFIVPVNIFIKDIAEAIGIPTTDIYILLLAIGLNALMLYLVSFIVPGVSIESLGVAIAMAFLLSVIALALVNIFHREELLLFGHF